MKTTCLSLLCCLLLSSAAAPDAKDGWTTRLIEWASDVIWGAEAVDAVAQQETFTPELLGDLSRAPASDTLGTSVSWPIEWLDVNGNLLQQRLLEERTVLLRDSACVIPLRVDSPVRIVYASAEPPEYLVDFARRFTDVVTVRASDRMLRAIPLADTLPTILVDLFAGDSSWSRYPALASLPGVIYLQFGGEPEGMFPGGWTHLFLPFRSRASEVFAAQSLFGAQRITTEKQGEPVALPVSLRHGYRLPEAMGIDRRAFDDVDRTIMRAIRYRATPGAQLTVLKGGQTIYEKSYGFHRYARDQAVRNSDLYDLASVTKAAATTFAVMKLYGGGRLRLDGRVRDYLPEYTGKVVGRYRVDQLLTHHSGLAPDLPVYPFFAEEFVAEQADSIHTLPLSGSRWLAADTPDLLRHGLDQVTYTAKPTYRYSDVNYVLLQLIVERLAGVPLDAFLYDNFYRPLGLKHMAFRPREHYPVNQLVPTIVDRWKMNRGELRGYVHDEGAAILGGVAGHAGLFANAHDLAVLFQLLNDRGRFAGRQLLSEETVDLFTARGPYNYRALGFDRLAGGYYSVIQAGASDRTVGHTGFSGTCVWADPDNDLVYVLLTNRIHPDPANERLMQYHTRGTVHRQIYRALHRAGSRSA